MIHLNFYPVPSFKKEHCSTIIGFHGHRHFQTLGRTGLFLWLENKIEYLPYVIPKSSPEPLTMSTNSRYIPILEPLVLS
jgi:hypothetical protein